VVPRMVAVNVPVDAALAASSLNAVLAAGELPACTLSDEAVRDVTPGGRPKISNWTVPEKPLSETTLIVLTS
jgi:hypothetical protein